MVIELSGVQFGLKSCDFKIEITPIRANQITGTTSDFKMGVLNNVT